MCSGLFSLPEWLGLQLLRLYRVRSASKSKVTPDLGAHWLAPLGPSRSGSILVLRLKNPVGRSLVQVATYIQHIGVEILLAGGLSEQLALTAGWSPPLPSAIIYCVIPGSPVYYKLL